MRIGFGGCIYIYTPTRVTRVYLYQEDSHCSINCRYRFWLFIYSSLVFMTGLSSRGSLLSTGLDLGSGLWRLMKGP